MIYILLNDHFIIYDESVNEYVFIITQYLILIRIFTVDHDLPDQ